MWLGDDTVPSSVRAKWVFVFPRKIYKNPGVSCHSLLQGIFPIQGLNLDLLHCRWVLYHPRGCFHLQNDIWKDYYPVRIFATSYLCGTILCLNLFLCPLSERIGLVLYLLKSCISGVPALGKMGAGMLENLCCSQDQRFPLGALR